MHAVAKLQGDTNYTETIATLALASSQHVSPPYNSYSDALRDWPRQKLRRARKALGMPSSKDVGTLARMLIALREQGEKYLGYNISTIALATPFLPALYPEDIFDALEYVGLDYYVHDPLDPLKTRMLHDNRATYAGYGFGLCDNYTDVTACKAQHRRDWQGRGEFIFAILYTKTSLAATVTHLIGAYSVIESPIRLRQLGSDTRLNNPNEEYYWEAVRQTILHELMNFHYVHLSKVIVTGDSAQDETFLRFLEATISSVREHEVELLYRDPVYVTAKGAAEMAKRAVYIGE